MKVKYIGVTTQQAYYWCDVSPDTVLKVGQVYEVWMTLNYAFSTEYRLAEFKDFRFCSACFEIVKDDPAMPNSDFWDAEGKRIKYGNWTPTHYAWIDGPVKEDGTYIQWLVVGPKEWVEIGGRQLRLEPVPSGCNIKGMVGLDRPCVARRQHKLIRENSEVRL